MKTLIRRSLVVLLMISSLTAVVMAQTDTTAIAQPDTLPKLTQGQARLLLLRSAILPGWGERHLGYVERSYSFNVSEIALWVTYLAFQWYGTAVENDMKAYAATHAGIDPKGKDQYYFTDIGNYDNIYEYNDQKLRYRTVNLLYPLTPEYYWAWDSESSRRSFDKSRIKSATALRNASFAIAGLVANRIISMLDIMVLTQGHLESRDLDIDSALRPTNDGLSFSLNINF
ncbi:MAG: hypothetical protein M0R34_05215 [Candidatus Marinimicrobia bacterium]|nr:hypothetical protein [Candidatus Neomarinimicrobiota bacterium]